MKRLVSSVRFVACALLVLASTRPAAAQQSASDRARLDDLAREAARKFASARALDVDQTRPTAPPPPAGAMVNLTLDEATARALERNLDIAVERLNPQTFDFSIAALDANYRPTFTSNVGVRSQSQFPRSQTAGADMLVTETFTGNTGVAQNVKWGGGSFALSFNNNRQKQSDLFATRNPVLNTNMNALYIQPLLRGFRIDGTRAQLRVTQLNQEMSEIALRGTIVRTLANVRNAYWDFVYAIEAADVAGRSLALATKLVEDNRARVEVGATETLDVAAAVRLALDNRTDLQQSQKQLAANDVALRNLSDQQLPALDLTGSYGTVGVGGPQFIRQGLGGAITRTVPSGYSDALRILADQTAPTWNFALNLSYPIGGSPAEANLARARIQQRQTIAQSRQMELQIATEVTNAALQVDSNRERVQAAAAARDLAERRLDAEQSRFDVGLSTNFFVVQAQRDLRDAQNAELRALLDYRRAQVEFARVQEVPTAGSAVVSTINAATNGANTPRAAGGGGGGFGR